MTSEIRSILVETYPNENEGEYRTISSRIYYLKATGGRILLETFLQEDEYGVIYFVGEKIEWALEAVHKHVCEKVDESHAYFLFQAHAILMKEIPNA